MRIVAILMVVVLLAGCMTRSEKSDACLSFATPRGYGESPWKPVESPSVETGGADPASFLTEVGEFYDVENLDVVWLERGGGDYGLCVVDEHFRVVAGFAMFANGDVENPTEKVITGCHMNARGGLLGLLDAKLNVESSPNHAAAADAATGRR